MMILCTSLLLMVGTGVASDELMRVAVLPVSGGVWDSTGATKLEKMLPDGFVSVPLTDALQTLHDNNEMCREVPRCLSENTPEGVDLVIDLSVTAADAGQLYDLRVLREGSLVNRRSEAVSSGVLWKRVESDLGQVLAGWHRDARLYSYIDHPQQGDRVRAELIERFPESPFTKALQRQ